MCETQHRIFKERRVFLFEKALAITKRRRDTSERETYINKEIFMVSKKKTKLDLLCFLYLQLQDISISGDMDIEKRNIVIYDISTGNKFTLKVCVLNRAAGRSKYLSDIGNPVQTTR